MENAHSSVIDLVTAVICLLLVAAAMLALIKRVKLPYTVALVLAGIGLTQIAELGVGFLRPLTEFHISPDVILFVFLPTLLFESAYHLDARQLRRNLLPVLTLAIPGLLLSTAMIGFFVHWVTGIDLSAAFLLGAILSATDPVAVIAIFKQLGAPKRLTILVEGESLFNDATAIVAAHILLAVAVAGQVSTQTVLAGIGDFFFVFFGGVLVGWVLAVATGMLLGKVESDSLIEISLTTILAYFSFLIAEHVLHVSGVMATVAAALTIGGWGRAKISPSVSGYLEHFWEYLAFVANSLIFLLVGLEVDLPALLRSWDMLFWVIVAMLGARAIVVYGLVPMVGKLPGSEAIDRRYQSVMYWGGLRGAIALAIVLSLTDFRYAELFTALVMGAVLFTLLVPAMTIEPLVKKLGLNKPPLADRVALLEGRLGARRAGIESLPGLQTRGGFSSRAATILHTRYQLSLDAAEEDLDELRKQELDDQQEYNLLMLKCLAVEKAFLRDMFDAGHLTEATFRQLAYTINLQADGLRYQGALPQIGWGGGERFRIRPLLTQALEAVGLPAQAEKLRAVETARNYEHAWAWYHASTRVLSSIDHIGGELITRKGLINKLRGTHEAWRKSARKRLDDIVEQFPEFVSAMQERLAERMLLHSQSEFINQQRRSGALPSGVAAKLLGEIEADVRRLRGLETGKLQLDPSELLRKVPMFMDLSEDEFARVSACLRQRTVPADDVFIKQDAPAASLYLIARGIVSVRRTQDGVSQQLAQLVAGDFVGESGFVTGEPRNASCHALTPCALYELRRSDVDKFRDACPVLDEALEKARQRRAADVCVLEERAAD